jgi:nucleolar complex protein 2
LSRKLKQVLDKIEENARVVEKERHKVSFSLNDRKAIDAWETNLKLKQTPLATFYESWNKVNLLQMAKRATNSDKVRHIKRNFITCSVQLLWVGVVKVRLVR